MHWYRYGIHAHCIHTNLRKKKFNKRDHVMIMSVQGFQMSLRPCSVVKEWDGFPRILVSSLGYDHCLMRKAKNGKKLRRYAQVIPIQEK